MRITAKVDYAIRALAELSVAEGPVTAERLAAAQDLPLKYLLGILGELRRARLVHSHRGPDGGFTLARPPDQVSLAQVFRAIDGPLAEVHDLSLRSIEYRGPAAELREVWKAVRASLRRVLDNVTLADLAASRLPDPVRALVAEYEADSPADERPAATSAGR